MDVSHGFHVFLDGNAWCAVGPHFRNLQESTAGFGDTPEAAVDEWRKESAKDSWWGNNPLPTFSEFAVHGPTGDGG
jgi:hypothetical protein